MIYRKFIFVVFLISLTESKLAYSSDFGVVGLVDIPTARMLADGTLTTTAAIQSRTNSYAISYQATPWLEGVFRYTGFNDNNYTYDRNYEVKMRLLKESNSLPQVAIGLRDIVGTGLWGSEYLVASKKVKNFDVTFGMGWGRLSGKGVFKNPLTYLSTSFDERRLDNSLGGELSTATFFSGQKIGFFGGISYQLNSFPASIMLEYNPDQYDFEVMRGAMKPKSPVSIGFKWDVLKNLSLTLSNQHLQEWGFELSASLDSKSLPSKPEYIVYKSSLDLNPVELPSGINQKSWYDALLFDAERSGLL